MKGLAELTKTTLIGGLLVVLPIYLSILLLTKTLGGLLSLQSPMTAAIPADARFRQAFAILIVLAVCLVVGLLVRTSLEACTQRSEARGRTRSANARMPCRRVRRRPRRGG
jgi:uncharacterized membrane protein